MEGFSLGPHHDLTQRKNVKQITEDRKLNCRQRVEAIVEVLTVSAETPLPILR
jgi:hypothetical protein